MLDVDIRERNRSELGDAQSVTEHQQKVTSRGSKEFKEGCPYVQLGSKSALFPESGVNLLPFSSTTSSVTSPG
jgi:hypothetical protein